MRSSAVLTHGFFSAIGRSSGSVQKSSPGREYFISQSRRFLIEILKADMSPNEVETMVREHWDGLDQTEKLEYERKANSRAPTISISSIRTSAPRYSRAQTPGYVMFFTFFPNGPWRDTKLLSI